MNEINETSEIIETVGINSYLLIRSDPSLASDLFWAVKDVTEKINKAPAVDIEDLKSGDVLKLLSYMLLMLKLDTAQLCLI